MQVETILPHLTHINITGCEGLHDIHFGKRKYRVFQKSLCAATATVFPALACNNRDNATIDK